MAMTNFRAQDMPGRDKKVEPKSAPKTEKKVEEKKVEEKKAPARRTAAAKKTETSAKTADDK